MSAYLDLFAPHSLELDRFTKGEQASISRTIAAFFREAEKELGPALIADPMSGPRSFQQNRLGSIVTQIAANLGSGLKKIGADVPEWAAKLGAYHGAWQVGTFEGLTGGLFAINNIGEGEILDLANQTLIEGAPSAAWWAKQSDWTRDAFSQQVRLGVLRGESVDQVIRRVRGKWNGKEFEGGVQGITTKNAEALVRSSGMKVLNDTNRAFMLANIDIVGAIQQVSTLDTRTTKVCRAYDGLMFSLPEFEPIGHSKPYAGGTPRHWQCRSMEVPVLWEELGGGELDTGLWGKGARASMFGPVEGDWDYYQWLKQQSPSVIRKVLGPKLAGLVEKGSMSWEQAIKSLGARVMTPGMVATARAEARAAATKFFDSVKKTLEADLAAIAAKKAAEEAAAEALKKAALSKQVDDALKAVWELEEESEYLAVIGDASTPEGFAAWDKLMAARGRYIKLAGELGIDTKTVGEVLANVGSTVRKNALKTSKYLAWKAAADKKVAGLTTELKANLIERAKAKLIGGDVPPLMNEKLEELKLVMKKMGKDSIAITDEWTGLVILAEKEAKNLPEVIAHFKHEIKTASDTLKTMYTEQAKEMLLDLPAKVNTSGPLDAYIKALKATGVSETEAFQKAMDLMNEIISDVSKLPEVIAHKAKKAAAKEIAAGKAKLTDLSVEWSNQKKLTGWDSPSSAAAKKAYFDEQAKLKTLMLDNGFTEAEFDVLVKEASEASKAKFAAIGGGAAPPPPSYTATAASSVSTPATATIPTTTPAAGTSPAAAAAAKKAEKAVIAATKKLDKLAAEYAGAATAEEEKLKALVNAVSGSTLGGTPSSAALDAAYLDFRNKLEESVKIRFASYGKLKTPKQKWAADLNYEARSALYELEHEIRKLGISYSDRSTFLQDMYSRVRNNVIAVSKAKAAASKSAVPLADLTGDPFLAQFDLRGTYKDWKRVTGERPVTDFATAQRVATESFVPPGGGSIHGYATARTKYDKIFNPDGTVKFGEDIFSIKRYSYGFNQTMCAHGRFGPASRDSSIEYFIRTTGMSRVQAEKVVDFCTGHDVDTINRIISTQKIRGQDMIVYRGAAAEHYLPAPVVSEIKDAIKSGKIADELSKLVGVEIQEGGFASTSIKASKADAFMKGGSFGLEIRLNILMEKTRPGVYIESITDVPGEYEIILPSGTKFRVIGAYIERGALMLDVVML